MANPWKMATIGLGLAGTTALGTGLTTAYLMRPPAVADAMVAETPAHRSVTARVVPATVASAPVAPAPIATTPATPGLPAQGPPRATPVSAPADCATGGDRAWRIAKPGLLGGLLGAGVGAAGGAIADGGKGAGKGALIGGLLGAAGGGAYGAYRTKDECGTILGAASAVDGTRAAFRSDPERITVYRAR